ncbi:glycoside hydrolase [Lasiosphaeris hirsuta]|uniref:Glycoside hydrolase n=1 Tax=Lasiosphaeris hirsuta TaxID=260670 RepID=A0AA40AY12_9PEZI|nr:glycoside hydrolase [Lasiosphaeris hirsuta]
MSNATGYRGPTSPRPERARRALVNCAGSRTQAAQDPARVPRQERHGTQPPRHQATPGQKMPSFAAEARTAPSHGCGTSWRSSRARPEIGTFSLEFTRLSMITGDAKRFDASQRIIDALHKQQNRTLLPGMWPMVTRSMNTCLKHTLCLVDEKRWVDAVMARAEIPAEEVTPEKSAALIVYTRLPEGFTAIPDANYHLRPEAIESVFILYRITGRVDLLESAWDIDVMVTEEKAPMADIMESFWLGEMLRYFYLIFSEPDLVSLHEYVFNTEMHPVQAAASVMKNGGSGWGWTCVVYF